MVSILVLILLITGSDNESDQDMNVPTADKPTIDVNVTNDVNDVTDDVNDVTDDVTEQVVYPDKMDSIDPRLGLVINSYSAKYYSTFKVHTPKRQISTEVEVIISVVSNSNVHAHFADTAHSIAAL